MPYIKQEDREHFYSGIDKLYPKTPGELNYLITRIAFNYLNQTKKNYQAFNDIIGALESCKLEFYRRSVAPYEDEKIKENGDVRP